MPKVCHWGAANLSKKGHASTDDVQSIIMMILSALNVRFPWWSGVGGGFTTCKDTISLSNLCPIAFRLFKLSGWLIEIWKFFIVQNLVGLRFQIPKGVGENNDLFGRGNPLHGDGFRCQRTFVSRAIVDWLEYRSFIFVSCFYASYSISWFLWEFKSQKSNI